MNSANASSFYSNFAEEVSNSNSFVSFYDIPHNYGTSASESFTSPSVPSPIDSLPSPNSFRRMEEMSMNDPHLEIVIQPIPKFRFRYRSEMQGAHGSLLGVSTDRQRKRCYPTACLRQYQGEAIIRCSLYTDEDDHKPHMHQLIARQRDREILDHEIIVSAQNGYTAEFKGLGIVHNSKKLLTEELIRKKKNQLIEKILSVSGDEVITEETLRRSIDVHESEIAKEAEMSIKKMDPNKVVLCFEAFCRDADGRVTEICKKVYSTPIQNMKSAETGELRICRTSKCAGSCLGGDEVFILVEKVSKKNIEVHFYEENEEEKVVWKDRARFHEIDVHHQYAIVFSTPPYRNTSITEEVKVKFCLYRPNNNQYSNKMSFTYKPEQKRYECTDLYAERSPETTNVYLSGQSSGLNNLSFESTELSNVIHEMEPFPENFQAFTNSDIFPKYMESLFDEPMDQEPGILVDIDGPKKTQMSPVDINIREKSKQTYVELNMPSKDLALRKHNEFKDLISTQMDRKSRYGKAKVLIEGTSEENAPLHAAVHHNQITILGEFLRDLMAADVAKLMNSRNYQKETPLSYAIRMGRDRCVRMLLLAGADVNASLSHGYKPLHLAVSLQQYKCVEELLTAEEIKRIEPDKKNDQGKTALHLAIEIKDLRCVELLIKNGANVNVRDTKTGNTCLHLAVLANSENIIKSLLQTGKVENVKNLHNMSALDFAKSKKDKDLIKLLENLEEDQEIDGINSTLKGFDFKDKSVPNDANASDSDVESSEESEPDDEDKIPTEESENDRKTDRFSQTNQQTRQDLRRNTSSGSNSSISSTEDGIVDKDTRDVLCQILDIKKTWVALAHRLELDYLIPNFKSTVSPARSLFQYLNFDKNCTAEDLRTALKTINEPLAVEAIDKFIARK